MQAKQLANAKKKEASSVTDERIKNKPCVKCGGTNRYPAPANRKIGQCIDCQKARYKNNKEHILENVSKWQKENKNKVRRIKSKWKKENPEKSKAQYEVMYAIRKGNLLPARECACLDCGAVAKDYHHEDYSKPLEVVPLCVLCHNARHANKK
jgi:hypothetical protein